MTRFMRIFGNTSRGEWKGPFSRLLRSFLPRVSRKESLRQEYTGRIAQVERLQLAFLVATFSMLSKLAEVDGYVSPEEVRAIDGLMSSDLGLDRPSKRLAAHIFNAARSSPDSFEDFALQFYREFHDRRSLLVLMIDLLVRVAAADGAIGRQEHDMIGSAVSLFDVDRDQYHLILARYSPLVDRHYRILLSSRSDSNDLIKRRYHHLVNEYHPDRFAAKGLPDELGRYASRKFREIQEAYERVRLERGF